MNGYTRDVFALTSAAAAAPAAAAAAVVAVPATPAPKGNDASDAGATDGEVLNGWWLDMVGVLAVLGISTFLRG